MLGQINIIFGKLKCEIENFFKQQGLTHDTTEEACALGYGEDAVEILCHNGMQIKIATCHWVVWLVYIFTRAL